MTVHFISNIDRRHFLAQTVGASILLGFDQVGWTGQDHPREGLIERLRDPQNLEFPFHTLNSFIVANDRFFVRNHFAVPALDTRTWRLRVEGAVKRPLELTYDQLRHMPARNVIATLECAGNGRALNVPPLPGLGWHQGAVGNAEWTGVPLAAVLERAGPRPGAVEAVLEGADRGPVTMEPRPTGPVSYARSLPLSRARQEDVLLAFRMNGADLPPAHGFPVGRLVPGWYGMASVKWLTRVIIVGAPFQGYWQTTDYSYFERVEGLPVMRPVTEIQVKSHIARPRANEQVRAGMDYRIHGAAWTGGNAEITRVEISTDGGHTWAAARLPMADATFRLAALGIYLARARQCGPGHAHVPGRRLAWPNSACCQRPGSSQLYDQPCAADRSASAIIGAGQKVKRV